MTTDGAGPQGSKLRLQVLLSRAGTASRRGSEALIAAGRVAVDGVVVREMGHLVAPEQAVAVDGQILREPKELAYIVLHKPRGVVSTAHDEQGRPTVLDAVGSAARLFPVGRLDMNSEGLMVLTNDGQLANRMMHPRFGLDRVYRALVDGLPTQDALGALRNGVLVGDRRLTAADVRVVGVEGSGTWLQILLREGYKRQIRLMCLAVGHPVRRLIRTRLGPLELAGLSPGEYRFLRPDEVRSLYAAVGLVEQGTYIS